MLESEAANSMILPELAGSGQSDDFHALNCG